MRRRAASFAGDMSGAAAIEAGLLMPLLVIAYMGFMELSYYLDIRRAVANASFSLVQSAGAADVIEEGRRARWQQVHDQSLAERRALRNVKSVLRGYVKAGGSIQQAWQWNLSQAFPQVADSAIIGDIDTQFGDGEGILVAVVQAEYSPLFVGFLLSRMTLTSRHAQVSIKKTVPIYR